jgi:hypothetical protein
MMEAPFQSERDLRLDIGAEHVQNGQGIMDRLVFGSTTHCVIREGCRVLTLHSGDVGVR